MQARKVLTIRAPGYSGNVQLDVTAMKGPDLQALVGFLATLQTIEQSGWSDEYAYRSDRGPSISVDMVSVHANKEDADALRAEAEAKAKAEKEAATA